MNKFRLFATLLVVALCTTTIFTSCNNNDDDRGGGLEIVATNVIGNTSRIAIVRAKIYDNNFDRQMTVGEAPFLNNGFRLQLTHHDLPGTVLHSFMSVVESEVGADGANNIIAAGNISDRDVKLSDMVFLYAYDRNNNLIGEIWLGSYNYQENQHGGAGAGYAALWVYADRHVSSRGVYRETEEDEWGKWEWEVSTDVSLRKGWNLVYGRMDWDWSWNESTGISEDTERLRLSSHRPSSANLQWEFDDWYDWSRSSHSATTRMTERRRSIFRR